MNYQSEEFSHRLAVLIYNDLHKGFDWYVGNQFIEINLGIIEFGSYIKWDFRVSPPMIFIENDHLNYGKDTLKDGSTDETLKLNLEMIERELTYLIERQ